MRNKNTSSKFVAVSLTILLLTSFFSLVSPTREANAAEIPKAAISLAPVNPDFTKSISKDLIPQAVSKDGKALGHIPSPIYLPGIKDKSQTKILPQTKASSFPSKYDLRTKNKLTPVRNQGNCGSCWAFATYGSLESCLLSGERTDFSENNLKNCSGFDYGPNEGGNFYMSTAYLARWDGPVAEADDPYDPYSTASPAKSPQKHVQDIQYFGWDGDTTYSEVKNAVMKYGAVDTSIYWDDNCYNSTYHTYYEPVTSDYANHDVAIVGWDDNFSKTKFTNANGKTPAHDGAFIIRNSWGTEWGDHGYFYISYDDQYIALENAVFDNAELINNYSHEYSYDDLGFTNAFNFDDTSNKKAGWFANVFDSIDNDRLFAVSFYTTAANSSYEIKVYPDFTGDFSASTSTPTTGTIDQAGYHTIKLNGKVSLTKGKKFAVAVKLITNGSRSDEEIYPIAIEEPINDYSSHATANAGESYVSADGTSWEDITTWGQQWETDFTNTNVCLKAFTEFAPDNEDTVDAVFAQDQTVKGGATVDIVSLGNSAYSAWFAPEGTTTFKAGTTMTQTKKGTDTSILAPSQEGTYKLYIINASGEVSQPSQATLTVDNTAPTDQDSVFSQDTIVKGGAAVTITPSQEANNTIWIAPAKTKVFKTGNTMSKTAGNATSILAPSKKGKYKLYVIDPAGNISAASQATLTIDNMAPTNQNSVFSKSIVIKAQQAVTIKSSRNINNTVWFAPLGTTEYIEGPTMTKAGGTATTIQSPQADGDYRLYVIDSAGNVSKESKAILSICSKAPENQDQVFTQDTILKGRAKLTIVSSGNTTNKVWLAPEGTTIFKAGAAMTVTKSGTDTSIVTPRQEGDYKLYIVDIAGNISSPSKATLTIDNTAPTDQNAVFSKNITVKSGASVPITPSQEASNTLWFAPKSAKTFTEGKTMAKAAGDATNIKAPTRKGTYKLYIVDMAGNISKASKATLTVAN